MTTYNYRDSPEKWRNLSPTLGSQPRGPALGRWVPIIFGFKNQWGLLQEELKDWETEMLLLKDLCKNSIILSTQHRAAAWKVPEPYEETHWLILWHLPEGQRSGGTFSKDGRVGRHCFCRLCEISKVQSKYKVWAVLWTLYQTSTIGENWGKGFEMFIKVILIEIVNHWSKL